MAHSRQMSPDHAIDMCMQTVATVVRVGDGLQLAEQAIDEFIANIGGDSEFKVTQLVRLTDRVLAVRVQDGTPSVGMAYNIETYITTKCLALRDAQ